MQLRGECAQMDGGAEKRLRGAQQQHFSRMEGGMEGRVACQSRGRFIMWHLSIRDNGG